MPAQDSVPVPPPLPDPCLNLRSQIHREVADFWHVLESCTNRRHRQLVGVVNAHLDALSRRIEGSVNAALEVRLAPAELRLEVPSAEQFHSNITDLLSQGGWARAVVRGAVRCWVGVQ
jgi:hypothetical protein